MESVNQFSVDYLEKLYLANPNENIITSPLSLASLLYILWLGAKGKTQDGISQALRLNTKNSQENYRDTYEKIIQKLHNDQTLKSANKIFVNDLYNVTETFKSFAENLNFKDIGKSTKKMNKWVESYTNGKIKNLIDQSSFTSETVMVLLSALYFKGSWKVPFTETREEEFQNFDGSVSNVQMMNEISRYHHTYIRPLNAEVLELSYQNSDIVMLICLPNKPDGLQGLLKKFSDVTKQVLNARLEEKFLSATLPKFKIESSLNLNGILSELGMSKAFSISADFGNLLTQGSGPVRVSSVFQKTFIEVDEKGTEAASGSGAVIVPRMSLEDFYCKHPFLFYLYHKTLRIPVMAGVVRTFK